MYVGIGSIAATYVLEQHGINAIVMLTKVASAIRTYLAIRWSWKILLVIKVNVKRDA
jgi:hypothetical protein